MKNVIGIDVGGSTTKIVGFDGRRMFGPAMVKASDPKASIFGAFGKFLDENHLALSDISRVMVTGVGSPALGGDIYGIKADRVEEFRATGRGGLYLSGLDHAVIVSMGTGTAYIAARGKEVSHLGGTGVGGGTLLGLSSRMINIRHFDALVETAEGGDLRNTDLFIDDITTEKIPTLPKGTTASNFGRISDLASNSDLALGIINMVIQTIGITAMFASRVERTDKIVLTGTLSSMKSAKSIFASLEPLYGLHYIIPEHAEFATATGAALCAEERA